VIIEQFFRENVFKATLEAVIQKLRCHLEGLDEVVRNFSCVVSKNLGLLNGENLCKQRDDFTDKLKCHLLSLGLFWENKF
jgi:hypothetical protein